MLPNNGSLTEKKRLASELAIKDKIKMTKIYIFCMFGKKRNRQKRNPNNTFNRRTGLYRKINANKMDNKITKVMIETSPKILLNNLKGFRLGILFIFSKTFEMLV